MPARKTRHRTAPGAKHSRKENADAFFRQLSWREILRPFDAIPGLLYIIKDRESRVMAISTASVIRMGYQHESEILGKRPQDYLTPELAAKYRTDDLEVLQTGHAKVNLVETWFNAQGRRDFVITSKYPLRNGAGKVLGLIGILRNLDVMNPGTAGFGPVGKAVNYIRTHLGEPLMIEEIARRVGLGARQLQRLFNRHLDQSIQQYIIGARIQAASDALITSEQTIAEIALRFGFNDQSAFTNTFRRLIGQSPKTYRDRGK